MRKLIILRGAPASGKSTFVKHQNLEPYSLCPDNLRIQIGGIILDNDGRFTINYNKEKEVWSLATEILDRKMSNGEFIIFDATFQRKSDFNMPLMLAKQYRYQVLCIDFSDVAQEKVIQRNSQRESYKQVPDSIIKRAYERFASGALPDNLEIISHREFENKSLMEHLDIKSINLNHYNKIHHIGDIHGCFDPVEKYLDTGLKENEFYIFVGDFIDRGIQNGKVVRWLLDDIIDKENVILIWGNHETHIHRFATDQQAISKEFINNTFPQLEAVGFTKFEANKLCDKLHDCFLYEYGNIKCLVTHAGVSKVPDNPILIPSIQYWKGTGTFEQPVDQTFTTKMADTDWIQVHGHRNYSKLPIQAAEKSYNLEAKIEFGGYLRILTLTAVGLAETIEIKNDIYRFTDTNLLDDSSKETIAAENTKISEEYLKDLELHKLVTIKTFESYPHIKSYNFSRRAFYKKDWDKVNITARGLFIDQNRRIVARSYNKFFNLEENIETKTQNLEHNLCFPLHLYVKENGFLGILGYDEITEDLFFASKSTPDSNFAKWFKEIFNNTVNQHDLMKLRGLIRDQNLSMIFEINDPLRDPHMIEYNTPHVVLLDIIYRTEKFTRLNYLELQKIAKAYGLIPKKQAMTFKNWGLFNAWHQSLDINYTFKGNHIEGFVAEDQNGFMFKIKLPYYNFWKKMRDLKERILTIRRSGGELKRDISAPSVKAFYEWIKLQDDQVLEADIIAIRKLYANENNNISI